MNLKAATLIEATDLAIRFRAIYAGTDWVVRIDRPLFDGDFFSVVVG